MALKDKLRRAMGRQSDHDSSDSSDSTPSTRPATGTTTPSEAASIHDFNPSQHPLAPSMTFTPPPLQKSNSTLRLTKTLTFRSSSTTKLSSQEKKEAKALKAWRKQDEEEWKAPKSVRPSKRKDKECQDKLRAWNLDMRPQLGLDGRNKSICSGVSPCASQRASLDMYRVSTADRKKGSLILGASSSEDLAEKPTVTHLQNVGTVPQVS